MKPIQLTVCGAAGRMGARILALAAQDQRFQTVAGVERKNAGVGGPFRGVDGLTPIVGNIQEVLPKTDAVIDFTSADAAVPTAQLVARAGRALVVGTTGLSPAQVKKLRDLSRRIPIVFSPNMSVGMNVLFELVAKAAASVGALRHRDHRGASQFKKGRAVGHRHEIGGRRRRSVEAPLARFCVRSRRNGRRAHEKRNRHLRGPRRRHRRRPHRLSGRPRRTPGAHAPRALARRVRVGRFGGGRVGGKATAGVLFHEGCSKNLNFI